MAAAPALIATVALGATIGGGVATAIGQNYEAKAKANMFKYQQGMALINKQIQEQNAAYARSVGEVEAQKVGMAGRSRLGAIKVAQARGGVDVNTGSAKEVQNSQEAIGRHDQSTVRANAARQAYGYEIEAAGAEGTAAMAGMGAANARTAGNIAVAGTLIGTAGAVAGKWYGAQTTFGGGGFGPGNGTDYAGLGGWR